MISSRARRRPGASLLLRRSKEDASTKPALNLSVPSQRHQKSLLLICFRARVGNLARRADSKQLPTLITQHSPPPRPPRPGEKRVSVAFPIIWKVAPSLSRVSIADGVTVNNPVTAARRGRRTCVQQGAFTSPRASWEASIIRGVGASHSSIVFMSEAQTSPANVVFGVENEELALGSLYFL